MRPSGIPSRHPAGPRDACGRSIVHRLGVPWGVRSPSRTCTSCIQHGDCVRVLACDSRGSPFAHCRHRFDPFAIPWSTGGHFAADPSFGASCRATVVEIGLTCSVCFHAERVLPSCSESIPSMWHGICPGRSSKRNVLEHSRIFSWVVPIAIERDSCDRVMLRMMM